MTGSALARTTAAITEKARAMYDANQVALIKSTVGDACTNDAELAMFIEVCARYELDPFSKQIWAIRIRGKLQIVVSRDGLLALANRSPDFRGCQSFEIRQHDLFAVRTDEQGHCQVTHEWRNATGEPSHGGKDGEERGPIIGAFAYVRREGHVDTQFMAYRDQYDKHENVWKSHPSAMMIKCFDPETEVLTDRGFELFSMVTGRILQVVEGRLVPTDAVPFAQHYDGPLVAADGRDLNFAVTPDHRMMTTDGVVVAQEMLDAARMRPQHHVPLTLSGRSEEAVVSDEAIALAAAYVADGTDSHRCPNRFKIEVSREAKVKALRALGIEVAAYGRSPGASAAAKSRAKSRRIVITQKEKLGFTYHRSLVERLVGIGKRIKTEALLGLSQRQARIFVDTWLAFDGDSRGHLYSSRPDHVAAFELAAVLAGYTVSPRRERYSDLSFRPNYCVTASAKATAPVVKANSGYYAKRTLHTRDYHGLVWCVTVPSGEIVVRRRGFSMRCGQCAEALSLRKAFSVSGVVGEYEVVPDPTYVAASPAPLDFGENEVLARELAVTFEALGYRRAKVRTMLRAANTEEKRQVLLGQLRAELGDVEEVTPAAADVS